ncbi:DNA polymerase III subunit delta [bacterium]|nr:DNA polymerase III subunit delta [bacterium]
MTTPVIQLLINNEEFLMLRHLHRLEKSLIDEATKDFNFAKVSAQDLCGAHLVDQFNTLPMMAETRLLIVTDVSVYRKQDLDVLTTYFENPVPTTNIILITDKVDKRTGFYKKIKKCGEIFEFKTLYSNQVPAFIINEAGSMGLKLAPGCAEHLSSVVGTNLMTVVSELEKLTLYVWPEKTVTLKQLNELVSLGLVENIFTISSLIAGKKYYELRNLYMRMKEQGEPVLRLMALIINHFRKLILLKEAQKQGVNQNELPHLLGVNPYFMKDYLTQARLFALSDLKNIYENLMTTSYQLRTINISSNTLFESFLQKVCVG